MANSKDFRELTKRISELRRHMLPRNFSATGDYSERVLDRARGFRVLCHAEIESFLEDIAKKSIKQKIIEISKSFKPSYTILSFVASYHTGWSNDESDPLVGPKKRACPKEKMAEAIHNAHAQYLSAVIKGNNGIKISNLKRIFIPLGIDFDDVDDAWLANVETYGQLRGEVAHQAKKVQKQIDPKEELNKVNEVLTGLKDFDALFIKVLKR